MTPAVNTPVRRGRRTIKSHVLPQPFFINNAALASLFAGSLVEVSVEAELSELSGARIVSEVVECFEEI